MRTVLGPACLTSVGDTGDQGNWLREESQEDKDREQKKKVLVLECL